MKPVFSVRSLLLIIAIAFTTLPVLLFGAFNVLDDIKEGKATAAEMNRRSAHIIQQGISAIVDQYTALAEAAALEIDLETLRPHDESKIVTLLRSYTKIIGYIVLNADARSVATYSVKTNIPTGVDYSDRPQIIQSRATKKTTVSGNVEGRAVHVPAVVIAVPLLDKNKQVAGFFSEAINPQELGSAFVLGPEEYGIVIDAYGRIVVSHTGKTSLTAAQLEQIAKDFSDASDGTQTFTFGSVKAELQVVTIEPLQWKVFVGSGPEFVTAESKSAFKRTGIVALACALAGVIIVSGVWLIAARGMLRVGVQLEHMSAADPRPIQIPRNEFLPAELHSLIEKFNQLLERASKAKLAEVEAICRVADYIFITSPGGTITYANESGLRDFGRVVGQNLKEFVGPGAAQVLFRSEMSHEWKGDTVMHRPDGSIFDAFLSATPILDEAQVTSIVVIIQDVTTEKAARESLAHSEKMITLGELVAGTSHELNNPLAVVMGYADLLLEDNDLNLEQRAQVEAIRKSALRASGIVHSMLAFARKRRPERVRTDVNAVINASADLKSYDIKTSGIHFEKILSEPLPPVFADPNQLQQVLLNVINNAQDAVLFQSVQPTIVIRTEAHAETVVITVEDNGPGIPKSELKKVFDPFFTTKPVGKGTGLGLSISYGIIREHNGDIRIQSAPGGGTQVSIELPIDKRELKDTAPLPVQPFANRSMRILVVDDEAEIVNVLSAGFIRGGFVVDTACSVRDATLLATSTLYDFVVTDVKMPGGSGIDLYKNLCNLDAKYRDRTVFLTGDISNPRTIQFFETEGLAYFSKPFKFEALDSFFRQKLASAKA